MALMNIGLKGDTVEIFSMKETDFNEEVFNEFSLTENTSIEEGKTYYSLDDGIYKEKVPESNPKEEGLYEAKPFYIYNNSLEYAYTSDKRPQPKLATAIGVSVDAFCEKPPYFFLNKDVKGLYFPLGDSLYGYDLKSFLQADYIQAKGVCPKENAPIYYTNSSGSIKDPPPVPGESVEDLFIKVEGSPVPVDRGINDIRTVYRPINFRNANDAGEEKILYGRDINFSYDGLKPGVRESDMNLLRYASGEKSWASNWSGCKCEASDNIFRAPDGLILTEIDNSAIFSTSLELEPGCYTFSFFIRVDDVKYNGSIEDINERWPLDDDQPILVDLPNTKGFTHFFNTNWRRHFDTFKIDISGEYTISLKITDLKSQQPIKICGLMLTKDAYLRTYDYKSQNYEGNGIGDEEGKSLPLDIYFLDNAIIRPDSDWSIMYKRKIDVITEHFKYFECIDSVGDVTSGYRNGEWFLLKEDGRGRSFSISKISNNKDSKQSYTENVCWSYKKSSNELHCYSSVDGIIADNYSSVNPNRFSTIMPNDDMVFNILLGGSIDAKNGLNLPMSATYSDLIIVDKFISKSEFESHLQYMMSLTPTVGYHEMYRGMSNDDEVLIDYSLEKNGLALRSSSIIETRRH